MRLADREGERIQCPVSAYQPETANIACVANGRSRFVLSAGKFAEIEATDWIDAITKNRRNCNPSLATACNPALQNDPWAPYYG